MSQTDTHQNIVEDIKRIRAALWGKIPFISSLLGRARIIVTELVPTAGVDEKTNIYISPKFWCGLDIAGKTWVISHELEHAVFLHSIRERSRISNPKKDSGKHFIWNIAADAVVNTMLEDLIRNPEMEQFAVTKDKIAGEIDMEQDEIEKMSVEEIYDLLLKKAVKIKIEVDLISSDGAEKDNGQVIQEGDPTIVNGSPDEIKEAWKKHVARAYMAQKTAGTVPEGLERLVGELIKPSIDPRSLIRRCIRHGLGKMIVSDWKRPSRRYPDLLPWIRRLRIPTIWELIDASGSIGEDELKLFLGTTYEFAKHTDIKTISFDTEAYDLVTARNKTEVLTKVAKHIQGGGGTMIRKALEQTVTRMKKDDIVLVLTDMEIFDLEDAEVKRLLATVASKSSACAFCTTHKETPIEGWRTIKLTRR